MKSSRVFHFIALLLLIAACVFIQVSTSQSEDLDSEESADFVISSTFLFSNPKVYMVWNNGDAVTNHSTVGRKLLGISNVEPSVVNTSCIFLHNGGQSLAFVAGQEYTLLVDVKNNGKSDLLMVAILGNIYIPNDHDFAVQELMAQVYIMEFVKPSTTRTFPYSFTVSEDLKVGKYNLVGTVLYAMDRTASNSTFFNGTIEIVETRATVIVRKVLQITSVLSVVFFLVLGCMKLYQKMEEAKRAKKEREEAENRWLLEDTDAGAAIANPFQRRRPRQRRS